MKLAVQENLIPGNTILEKLQNAEKYGFEGVEVWGNDLPQRFKEVKDALSASRVKISTVCSGYGGDLLGPDRKTREMAIEGIKERLKLCAELGGVGVITVPTFSGPKIPDLYPWMADVREVEKKILIEECKILGKWADDVGAYVLLEPLNRYETHLINRLQQAVEICNVVGAEHVKIMADFFHMNIEEANIAKSIEEAGGYIMHVHLADSNRLLPGYGHTDFKSGFEALKKIGYKNFMALECRIPGDPSIELPKCVNYLRSLI
ncbi:MAG: sugar phosphate isomerase/epimerase [Candidatus Bathyarchaeia archaeon]|nr:sugar phosphate isomerase/epimerase [Candidatus Bathyarchaeota archaeon]